MSSLSGLPSDRADLAVKVDSLSITYKTAYERKPTLRQTLVRFGRGQRTYREVKAIQNISFVVPTNTSVGIIGANGAGKSTLMRAIAGILPPTRGTIEVWGRASTLLALGVGFNKELSGRENIVLGGLASGLSRREVEERADDVAEWTELGDFIEMPMRTYSSGMSARVAFSVAVHMKPDILMIDEALSTGDAHFREKAGAKMAELRESARAMFLVSHGLGSIREMCTEVLWLDRGKLMMHGEPGGGRRRVHGLPQDPEVRGGHKRRSDDERPVSSRPARCPADCPTWPWGRGSHWSICAAGRPATAIPDPASSSGPPDARWRPWPGPGSGVLRQPLAGDVARHQLRRGGGTARARRSSSGSAARSMCWVTPPAGRWRCS